MRISDWSSDVCSSDWLLAAVNIAISLTLSEQSGVLATAQPRSTFLIFAGVLALARMIWAERRRDASLILSMARRWALLAARRCTRSPLRKCLPILTPELPRSEEHTAELQSLMRLSYAVFCLKKKKP